MIDEIKIMQYADGMLPIEEKEEVEKAIQDIQNIKNCLKIIRKLVIYYLN